LKAPIGVPNATRHRPFKASVQSPVSAIMRSSTRLGISAARWMAIPIGNPNWLASPAMPRPYVCSKRFKPRTKTSHQHSDRLIISYPFYSVPGGAAAIKKGNGTALRSEVLPTTLRLEPRAWFTDGWLSLSETQIG
jgi:hypothetical protein